MNTASELRAELAQVFAQLKAGNMDAQEDERQHAEYCEMVKLWKETNGEHGWPAYNGEGTCR